MPLLLPAMVGERLARGIPASLLRSLLDFGRPCLCLFSRAAKTPTPPKGLRPETPFQLGYSDGGVKFQSAGQTRGTPQLKLEKIHLSIGVFPKSSSAWKAGLPRETWFISQTPWPVAGCNGPHKHLLMMWACIRACCHTIVRLGLLPLQMPICKRNQKGADWRGCASACAHKRGPEDPRVERNVCVSAPLLW